MTKNQFILEASTILATCVPQITKNLFIFPFGNGVFEQ